MISYKILKKKIICSNNFKLKSLRSQDRYKIMRWRNEQMYHLRQTKKLTKKDQDLYFKDTIYKQFSQDKPEQILFSFLENDICIGYGGLVHINWKNKTAEISFLIDTNKEKVFYKKYWKNFLTMIESVAFKTIKLDEIYTYAYDLRKHLYPVFEKSGFVFKKN